MPRVARYFILIAAVFVVIGAVQGIRIWQKMDRVVNTPLTLSSPILFTISSGESMSTIARNLENAGWISNHRLLELRSRVDGVATEMQAGTYEIGPGDTPMALLSRFQLGATKDFRVTFVEGCKFSDMRRALAAQTYLTHTIESKSDSELLIELGINRQTLEGLFFPSTYSYSAGSTDVDILKRAHSKLQRVLKNAWAQRADGLPFDAPYDALIMASIIEKETGQAEERPKIAGVLVRRLKKGMRLQTDPTVIYGMGSGFDGNLTRKDLIRDTPYNTYARFGLPPSPIAMPGAGAIDAAINPKEDKAIYFVSKGDGTHEFSETLAEHEAAVRRFQINK